MEEQKSIDLASKEIKIEIAKNIQALLEQRKKAAGLYGRLKRTPFEALEDKGLMNPDNLFSEYQKITDKKSVLGASERRLVENIVITAMQKVIQVKINEIKAKETNCDKDTEPCEN